MSFFRRAVTLLILLFCYFISSAKLIYPEEKSILTITSSISYFIDSTEVCTLEDIKQLPHGKFNDISDDVFEYDTKNPIWFKFSFANTGFNQFILFNAVGIDSAVLYQDKDVQFQGELVKESYKRYTTFRPVFQLTSNHENVTCWVRLESSRGLNRIRIQLGEGGMVFNKIETSILILSGFIFLMVFIFIFNSIFYIFTKNKSVLYFSFFNFFTILLIGAISGLFIYLPFDLNYYLTPYLAIFLSLLMLSGIFMSDSILNIRKDFPGIFKVLIAIVALILCCMVMVFIGYEELATMIINPLGIVIIPVYIIASYRAYKKGHMYALYYLIGWSVYFVVMVAILLMVFNVVNYGEYEFYLTPSISVIDFFLIMATVISKINEYRKAKELSEKERLAIIQEQNNLLENKVKERTKELQLLNEEVALQNEELQSQKEHISNLNDSLEKKVEERTVELKNTLSSLQLRTNDLENFSYVISHNLRGPVTTLLGLTQIFNFDDLSDPSNKEVMSFTKRSVEGLDKVIVDLNYIVNIKNIAPNDSKKVLLSDVLKLSCDLLEREIHIKKAKIEADFSVLHELNSVSAYLQNIFYNLISNGVKYARDNQAPIVKIKSYEDVDNVIIEFADNGIGIDLEKINTDKIFKMFQRFNTNQEGKGLGLYLVKYQVELLKGTIDVKSVMGEGTTFTIRLPK